jgi:hypothetical protein
MVGRRERGKNNSVKSMYCLNSSQGDSLWLKTDRFPDCLLRITTPAQKVQMVGDACLASPKHQGKKPDKSDIKPYNVELCRRMIGWSAEGDVIGCHPLGGFVPYPSLVDAWKGCERLPAAPSVSTPLRRSRGKASAKAVVGENSS